MYLTQDTTGSVGVFANLQVGYTPSTQAQIDDYELNQAKNGPQGKVIELKTDLKAWRDAGFVYTGNLPAAATFNLAEESSIYAKNKSDLALGGVNKYCFYDKGTVFIPRVKQDFVDAVNFLTFIKALCEEEERIMELSNDYRRQITAAATVAAVDAITISFAP